MSGTLTFISYNRDDSEFATKLAADLRSAGFNIWFDQMDIPAGTRWDIEIQKALESAGTVLVILSPASVASNNVLDEVSYAIDQNKRVIPVMMSDCAVPIRLRRFQYIDFINDYEAGFNRLIRELGKPVASQPGFEPQKPGDVNFRNTKRAFNKKWLFISAGVVLLIFILAIKPWKLNKAEDNALPKQETNKDENDKQGGALAQALSVSYSPSKIVSVDHSFQLNILKAKAEKLNDKIILTVSVKAISESPYGYAISTGDSRIQAGEDKYAPDNFYAEAIPGHSFKTFDLVFNLPANANQFELLQYYGEKLLGSVLIQVK